MRKRTLLTIFVLILIGTVSWMLEPVEKNVIVAVLYSTGIVVGTWYALKFTQEWE